MKKGDTVTIYYDPQTEMRPEGQAQLLLRISDDGDREMVYWWVKFLGRGEGEPRVCRFIKKKEGGIKP